MALPDRAAPVPGVDYAAVPTIRLPQDVPLPPASTVRPVPATSWRIVAERRAYDSDIQRTTVHRADCWGAKEGQEIASEQEARAAMSQPGARGCTLCGTDQSLS